VFQLAQKGHPELPLPLVVLVLLLLGLREGSEIFDG